MDNRVIKTIKFRFDKKDCMIIERLIRNNIGKKTIASVLDEFNYVDTWYIGMLSMFKKVCSGDYIQLDYYEHNVLSNLLKKALENDAEPDKDAIKVIADTIKYSA